MTGTQRSRPVLGEGEGGKDRDTYGLAVLGESEGLVTGTLRSRRSSRKVKEVVKGT